MIVYGSYYYYPLEIKRCESGFYGREIPAINKINETNKTIRGINYKFYCKELRNKNYYKYKNLFYKKDENTNIFQNLNIIEKKILYLLNKPISETYNKKGVIKKYNSIFLDTKV